MSARSRNPLADWPQRRARTQACLSPRQHVRLELIKLNWSNPHPLNGTPQMIGLLEGITDFVTGDLQRREVAVTGSDDINLEALRESIRAGARRTKARFHA